MLQQDLRSILLKINTLRFVDPATMPYGFEEVRKGRVRFPVTVKEEDVGPLQKGPGRTFCLSSLTADDQTHVEKTELALKKHRSGSFDASTSHEDQVAMFRNNIMLLPLELQTKNALLGRLDMFRRMTHESSERSHARMWFEKLFLFPWKDTEPNPVPDPEKVLEQNIHGLTEVKNTFLDILAWKRQNPTKQAPVVCLVGRKGVGKTVALKAFAGCLNVPFANISMAGEHGSE